MIPLSYLLKIPLSDNHKYNQQHPETMILLHNLNMIRLFLLPRLNKEVPLITISMVLLLIHVHNLHLDLLQLLNVQQLQHTHLLNHLQKFQNLLI